MAILVDALLAAWAWSGIARHWAAIAIALTCLSLVVFCVLVMAKYTRICMNLFVDTPPPQLPGPVDFQRLEGERVRFRSFDGVSLQGMHLRTPNRSAYRGTIVFCHEFGADLYSCARYARPLIDAGFDVFTFDFRGHGQSSIDRSYNPLQWPSDKELADVLGACAYVESALEADGRPAEVGLFGISRGAGAGLLAASSDPNIRAIVCDGAFSTHATGIAYMKRWAHIFARIKLVYENHAEAFWRLLLWLMMRAAQSKQGCRFPSVDRALKEMEPRPILFIHGRRDTYIQVEQTQFLYDQAPEPKYLWLVGGAKHNQGVIVEPKQYAARTIAFFRKHLAGEAVEASQVTSPADVEVA